MRRSRRRRILFALALVAVALAAGLVWGASHPALEPRPGRVLPRAAADAGGLRVTWMGCTTLLVDDGETQVLVDGFFSRPGPLRVLLGRIGPDEARIEAGLARAGVERLAAVLTAHSHYDHALDAPHVAARTGALLVGSESTAMLARGAGLSEAQLRVVEGGERFEFGRLRVRVLRALHTPGTVGEGAIEAPLALPARVLEFRAGGSFAFLFEHEGRRLLVQPSTNVLVDAPDDLRAEVVLLGTAQLGRLDDDFVRGWWRASVAALGARRVVPIHWDDFLRPPEPEPLPMPRLLDDFRAGVRRLDELARADGVDVGWLPFATPVDVFARD